MTSVIRYEPQVAVVHMTTVQISNGEFEPSMPIEIKLDHQANAEVCDSIRRMFDRLEATE